MKQLLIFTMTMTLILAVGAMGATKEDRKAELIATGDYISVSDPVLIPVGSSPIDRLGKKWAIVITAVLPTDSSVVRQKNLYLWVEDTAPYIDSAYWANGYSPTAETDSSFHSVLITELMNRGLDGYVAAIGVAGNKEWAKVVIYEDGTVGHVIEKTAWVTRIDGGALEIKVLE